MIKQMAVPGASAFQDSEYFVPEVTPEGLGVKTGVVSLRQVPMEIHSHFSRTGPLHLNQTIDAAKPEAFAQSKHYWV